MSLLFPCTVCGRNIGWNRPSRICGESCLQATRDNADRHAESLPYELSPDEAAGESVRHRDMDDFWTDVGGEG